MLNNKLKIAVCAIMYNENDYIEEWLNYHRNKGITDFIIYDNNSNIPIKDFIKSIDNQGVIVIDWTDNEFKSQSRAYEHCCKNYSHYDYIAFIDADEFIDCKDGDIISNINFLIKFYGKFDGLGMYWRIYGSNNPYFETRQPVGNYTKYSKNFHIKSLVNPKKVTQWLDPHKATLVKGSNYIDEKGFKIINPIGTHTSDIIWIKHCFTRSKTEFLDKMKRGDANLRKNIRTMDDFYNYNNDCTFND